MPCYDPRDNISIGDIERCRDEQEAHYKALENKYNKIVDLLCDTCGKMESDGITKYINDNPELRLWWEDHKKMDVARKEKEKRDAEAAFDKVRVAISYIEKYQNMMSADLPEEDKDYFKKKIKYLMDGIKEAFELFPSIAKEFSQ